MKKIAAICVLQMLSFSAFAYGAIAIDQSDPSTKPAYGFSINQPTRQRAEQVAMGYCRKYAANCKVVVWFETCGAYANSARYYGYGFGTTKAKATADALTMCARNSCEIVVAECERR